MWFRWSIYWFHQRTSESRPSNWRFKTTWEGEWQLRICRCMSVRMKKMPSISCLRERSIEHTLLMSSILILQGPTPFTHSIFSLDQGSNPPKRWSTQNCTWWILLVPREPKRQGLPEGNWKKPDISTRVFLTWSKWCWLCLTEREITSHTDKLLWLTFWETPSAVTAKLLCSPIFTALRCIWKRLFLRLSSPPEWWKSRIKLSSTPLSTHLWESKDLKKKSVIWSKN